MEDPSDESEDFCARDINVARFLPGEQLMRTSCTVAGNHQRTNEINKYYREKERREKCDSGIRGIRVI